MYNHGNQHIANASRYDLPVGARPVLLSEVIVRAIHEATGYIPKNEDGLFVIRQSNGQPAPIADSQDV